MWKIKIRKLVNKYVVIFEGEVGVGWREFFEFIESKEKWKINLIMFVCVLIFIM